jgi:hypothetical protein
LNPKRWTAGGQAQPEHEILSVKWNGKILEVLSTSQKQRIAHELKKASGGETSCKWSDEDGTLLARWRHQA